jgi:GntR family transcriptional regulator of gluconate operon
VAEGGVDRSGEATRRPPSGVTADGPVLSRLRAPRPLAEDAADVIRDQILSGGFRRGERLVEARIAEQLNISRGPVREAFKLLRSEGLVAEEPRRGTFVVVLDADDVREIYDLRAALEGRAARLLAGRRDGAAIAELRSAIGRIEEAAAAGDPVAVGRHDLGFHEALCRLSGNRRIHATFLQHARALRTLIRFDEYLYGSSAEIGPQHHPVLEAIEAGDGDLAAARAEHHCESAKELLSAYFEGLDGR